MVDSFSFADKDDALVALSFLKGEKTGIDEGARVNGARAETIIQMGLHRIRFNTFNAYLINLIKICTARSAAYKINK